MLPSVPDTAPSERPDSRASRLPTLFFLLTLGALVLATYQGALRAGFVWDDIMFIQENRFLEDSENLSEVFVSGDSVGTGYDNPYYRPLTTSFFLFGKQFWGNNPMGYHTVGLTLHFVVCALPPPFFPRRYRAQTGRHRNGGKNLCETTLVG